LADNGAFVGVPTFFLIVQRMFHASAFLEQSSEENTILVFFLLFLLEYMFCVDLDLFTSFVLPR
jgi:hypothetical protein